MKSSIVLTDFTGLYPLIESERLYPSIATKAIDVDVSSKGIMPASFVKNVHNIGVVNNITSQPMGILSDDKLDAVISSTVDTTYKFYNGTVKVNRNPSEYDSVVDEYVLFPIMASFSTSGITAKLDKCKSRYRTYRLRYICDTGEYSDVLGISEVIDNEGDVTLTWSITNTPSNGKWYIERLETQYLQLSKHNTTEQDSYVVIGSTASTSFIDSTPIGYSEGRLSHIDYYTIDTLTYKSGIVTNEARCILFNDNELYVSYNNMPYAFPESGFIDVGETIIALVESENGVLVFTTNGMGILLFKDVNNEILDNVVVLYNKLDFNIRCVNPNTISTINDTVTYLSDEGVIIQNLTMKGTSTFRNLTHARCKRELQKLDYSKCVGQCFSSGYYLTDGSGLSWIFTNYQTTYGKGVIIRNTRINSRVVTSKADGWFYYVENGILKRTRFEYLPLDGRDPILVTVFKIDGRGKRIMMKRPLSHNNIIRLPNNGMYTEIAIHLKFSNGSEYETKLMMTDGMVNFNGLNILRKYDEDLAVYEISLLNKGQTYTANRR